MPQSLKEYSITFIVFKVESHHAHHCIKVDQFGGLRLKVVAESIFEFLFELVGTILR